MNGRPAQMALMLPLAISLLAASQTWASTGHLDRSSGVPTITDALDGEHLTLFLGSDFRPVMILLSLATIGVAGVWRYTTIRQRGNHQGTSEAGCFFQQSAMNRRGG